MPRRYQVHDIDPAPVIERLVVSEAAAFSFPKPRSCRNGAKPRVVPAVHDLRALNANGIQVRFLIGAGDHPTW